jgi:pimeloyl-ACP methyl ester carboxylesterase
VGERDDSAFRPAQLLIGEIRAAVGTLDLHRIPKAGHWSAYENAPEVNRLLLEFLSSSATPSGNPPPNGEPS